MVEKNHKFASGRRVGIDLEEAWENFLVHDGNVLYLVKG